MARKSRKQIAVEEPVIESAFDGSFPLLSTIQTSATFHCVLTP